MPQYTAICHWEKMAGWRKCSETPGESGISWYKFVQFGVLNNDKDTIRMPRKQFLQNSAFLKIRIIWGTMETTHFGLVVAYWNDVVPKEKLLK